jgi:hypothetical protein
MIASPPPEITARPQEEFALKEHFANFQSGEELVAHGRSRAAAPRGRVLGALASLGAVLPRVCGSGPPSLALLALVFGHATDDQPAIGNRALDLLMAATVLLLGKLSL